MFEYTVLFQNFKAYSIRYIIDKVNAICRMNIMNHTLFITNGFLKTTANQLIIALVKFFLFLVSTNICAFHPKQNQKINFSIICYLLINSTYKLNPYLFEYTALFQNFKAYSIRYIIDKMNAICRMNIMYHKLFITNGLPKKAANQLIIALVRFFLFLVSTNICAFHPK